MVKFVVEDVIKTAGKAALLSGERQEMEKFLSLEIPLQAMDLEIGINLYKKILGSMRKVELQKCSEELKDKLQKQAQHILAQGPTGINSMDVDQLLRWYKHLVRHDPQNDAKHIFDKTSPKTFVQLYPSTDLIIPSGPKLFLIFFLGCFRGKKAEHFGCISPKNLPQESFGLVGYFPKMSQKYLRTRFVSNLVGDISHQ